MPSIPIFARALVAAGMLIGTAASSKGADRLPEIAGTVPPTLRTDDMLDYVEGAYFGPLHPARKSKRRNVIKDRMHFRALYRRMIDAYAFYGRQYGVRWDFAVFQMMHETDSLRFTGRTPPGSNNFAGIGVTGDPAHWRTTGDAFESVERGALAHVQHLAAYADLFRKHRPDVQRRVEQLTNTRPDNSELEGRLKKGGVPGSVLEALKKKLKPADYRNLLMQRTAAVEAAVKIGLIAPRTRFTWYHDIKPVTRFDELEGRWAADRNYAEKLAQYAKEFAEFVRNKRRREAAAGNDLRGWFGRWTIDSRHTFGAYNGLQAGSTIAISPAKSTGRDPRDSLRIVHGGRGRIVTATPTRLRYIVTGRVNSVTVELFRKGDRVQGNFSGVRLQDGKSVGGTITGKR